MFILIVGLTVIIILVFTTKNRENFVFTNNHVRGNDLGFSNWKTARHTAGNQVTAYFPATPPNTHIKESDINKLLADSLNARERYTQAFASLENCRTERDKQYTQLKQMFDTFKTMVPTKEQAANNCTNLLTDMTTEITELKKKIELDKNHA